MPKFLETPKTRIAYHAFEGKKPLTIMFLGGFMSDMTGTKALAIEAFAKAENYAFVRFDYFGHGESSGDFKDGTIGHWKEDVLNVIDHLTEGPLMLVGSSMGGWLMLLAARERQARLHGLVGIAAAPDFTQNCIWDVMNEAQKEEMRTQGQVLIPCDDPEGGDPYPITLRLIEEARAHLLLHDVIEIDCPVRLLQGGKDTDVPADTPLKLVEKIRSDDVMYELVKDATHRFSRDQDIELIKQKVRSLF